ncbi:MAG: peptidoglycan-associated lipoprotein [Deltaproteobacteria bacterium CG11_big_fil_rev_8_21_14_0_20_49_13]|nr:MAG: peptidoglycan-associated lipoprotein [Deltaproteobacteria bacterium CG11_big_fil_rev_8_21_14_0_20_49_13]
MRKLSFIAAAVALAGCAKSGINVPSSYMGESKREAAAPPVTRVYFPFASDVILPAVEKELDQNVSWLKRNNGIYIILEGHCDEVGPKEYNMELGDRRARTVKAYLMEMGVDPERVIMLVSYGSERPLNPGHKVEDLRENRRAEFVTR